MDECNAMDIILQIRNGILSCPFHITLPCAMYPKIPKFCCDVTSINV